MKSNRRSDKNRADKYSSRAAAMLDQFHYDRAESLFLALMESKALTIDEIRELTWAQVRNSYEGIIILDRPVPLRDKYLDEVRNILETGIDCYGNELASSDGSPRIITKETLKDITRELDQFKS